MGEWRPIETAPRDGRWVLIGGPKMPIPLVATPKLDSVDGWFAPIDAVYGPNCQGVEATHWMPLPDPPSTPRVETKEPAR